MATYSGHTVAIDRMFHLHSISQITSLSRNAWPLYITPSVITSRINHIIEHRARKRKNTCKLPEVVCMVYSNDTGTRSIGAAEAS